MADERNRERDAAGARDQDGLGRDAAHGGDASETSGGSYGRNPGRAGDDLLQTGDAGRQRDEDDATARQRESGLRRQGLEGKGFDAGGGYGGGGNDSLYNAESGYGGQAGGRESSMRGAYAGDDYGREGDQDLSDGASADQGRSVRDAKRDADIPRGTDEHADDATGNRRRGSPGRDDDDRNTVDLDERPDAGRRDPTR